MSRAVEERINALAARQHGLITRRQLLAAGLSPSALGRRAVGGRLHRLHAGVYRVGPLPGALEREMAAVLACGPTAVLSHGSAASVWGLVADPSGRTGSQGDRRVHVTVVGGSRAHTGVHVHRTARLPARDRTVRDGLPVTAPLRTLADLAAVLALPELEQVVARAEREGLVTRRDLRALVRRERGRPGVAALRTVLALDGGPAPTRSEAEVRFLALVRRAGLPAPEVNVRFGPYELDFLWRAARLAVEVDGYRTHGRRQRFEADRRRDAWLAARGVQVVRLSWRQVTGEEVATAVQVAQALAGARLSRLRRTG